MRKTFKTYFILMFLMVIVPVCLNQDWLSFKVKTVTNENVIYALNIVISGGIPPYTIQVWDNNPEKGGKILIQRTNIEEEEYSIEDLKQQTYYLRVSDANDQFSGTLFEVK